MISMPQPRCEFLCGKRLNTKWWPGFISIRIDRLYAGADEKWCRFEVKIQCSIEMLSNSNNYHVIVDISLCSWYYGHRISLCQDFLVVRWNAWISLIQYHRTFYINAYLWSSITSYFRRPCGGIIILRCFSSFIIRNRYITRRQDALF